MPEKNMHGSEAGTMILKSNVANPDSSIDPRTILLDQDSDRRPRFTRILILTIALNYILFIIYYLLFIIYLTGTQMV